MYGMGDTAMKAFGNSQLLITDITQSVLQRSSECFVRMGGSHTPFGWTPASAMPQGGSAFNGKMREPVTACYHLGHGYRVFNPLLMRFYGPDSHSPFGRAGLNCYAYCAGDPINRRDDDGHMWSWIKTRLGAAATEAIAPAASNLSLAGAGASAVFARATATYPSLIDVLNPKQIGPGVVTWTTPGWKPDLWINAHGTYTGDVVFDAKKGISARIEDIYQILVGQGTDFTQYNSVHLLICHSGKYGLNSSAARLSGLTGLPVTGYRKFISTAGGANIDAWVKRLEKVSPDVPYPRVLNPGTSEMGGIRPSKNPNARTFEVRQK